MNENWMAIERAKFELEVARMQAMLDIHREQARAMAAMEAARIEAEKSGMLPSMIECTCCIPMTKPKAKRLRRIKAANDGRPVEFEIT